MVAGGVPGRVDAVELAAEAEGLSKFTTLTTSLAGSEGEKKRRGRWRSRRRTVARAVPAGCNHHRGWCSGWGGENET